MVYLGHAPKYVFENLSYLNQVFPEYDIYLVSDTLQDNPVFKHHRINLWLCQNPRDGWSLVSSISSHNRKFRNDFWFKTVARFFSLHEFMKTHGGKLLHIEADVWLSENFPMSIFDSLGPVISYPLKNPTEGIASTLFIGSEELMGIFCRYIEVCFEHNSHSTDVGILGKFHSDYPELFLNLPTVSFQELLSARGQKEKSLALLSTNFHFFGGVFDASTLGIFFTGIDPRNNWGFRDLFVSQNHLIDPEQYDLQYSGGGLFYEFQGREVDVFSLHVHSKDLRMFNRSQTPLRLQEITSWDRSHRKREVVGYATVVIFAKTCLVAVYLRLKSLFREAL